MTLKAPPPAVDPQKAHELNVTLAVVTGVALALLVVSAAFFGPAQRRWVVIVLAPAIVALYLLFKRYVLKRPEQPSLIQADAPITLIMAAAIPLVIVIVACCAAAWPGHDYSIAVLAASVIFGLTLESALKQPQPKARAMYVCGLVIPVPEDKIDAYRAWAENGAKFFKDYGCLEIVESWEDFVPDGKQTDFRKAVAAKPGEKIVFTWQIWPDRERFQIAEAKMHEDARMDSAGDPPFDASRLILGCFQPIAAMGRD